MARTRHTLTRHTHTILAQTIFRSLCRTKATAVCVERNTFPDFCRTFFFIGTDSFRSCVQTHCIHFSSRRHSANTIESLSTHCRLIALLCIKTRGKIVVNNNFSLAGGNESKMEMIFVSVGLPLLSLVILVRKIYHILITERRWEHRRRMCSWNISDNRYNSNCNLIQSLVSSRCTPYVFPFIRHQCEMHSAPNLLFVCECVRLPRNETVFAI